MKKHIILLQLFSLSCLFMQGQLNESDTVKLQLRTSLTGNYQQGNVNILTIRSRVEFLVAPSKHIVFKSQNSSLYQEFSSVKADNDVFSRNYIYYKPQRRVYPFAIAYISSNYRRKTEQRIFGGAGITVQLVRRPLHALKLSASTVFESTRFSNIVYNETQYNGTNKIRLWRGTLYAGGWSYLLKNHLRLYYDAYWQPAFSNKRNYRTQADIGLDFLLWKGLSFNTLYTYTHEQVVIKGVKQDDKILTFGLSYTVRARHAADTKK